LTESFFRELSGREMRVVEVLVMAALLILSLRCTSLYFSLGTVAPAEAPGLSEVYAKVLPLEALEQPASQNTVRLQFTWLPEDVKKFLSVRRAVH
jgi:hypothetical protein